MPIHLTWKSIVGFLAMASGVITAITTSSTTLPHNVEVVLIAAGGVILAVERYADAIDNQTSANAPPPTVTAKSDPVLVAGVVQDSAVFGSTPPPTIAPTEPSAP